MITRLPDGAKNNLPKHAQGSHKDVFNSAEEQKYEKDENGNWVEKK